MKIYKFEKNQERLVIIASADCSEVWISRLIGLNQTPVYKSGRKCRKEFYLVDVDGEHLYGCGNTFLVEKKEVGFRLLTHLINNISFRCGYDEKHPETVPLSSLINVTEMDDSYAVVPRKHLYTGYSPAKMVIGYRLYKAEQYAKAKKDILQETKDYEEQMEKKAHDLVFYREQLAKRQILKFESVK